MQKQALVFAALFGIALSCTAVDVNHATEAELDGIKGLGPGTTEKILRERQKAPFRDWADLIRRVNGVGKGSAAKLSSAGLSVGGSAYPQDSIAPAQNTR